MVVEVKREWGGVDVLVSHARIAGWSAPRQDLTDDDWCSAIRALAKEVATCGILVDSVAPAVIETDILRQVSGRTPASTCMPACRWVAPANPKKSPRW